MTGQEAAALGEGVRGSLATLKDVAGIAGSFVCTHSGWLVAREIPSLFEDAVLAEAGSRLLRIGETFAAGGDTLEFAIVRYGEHRLYLKAVGGGVLCIVVAGEVNMPALRMAANLVARRIAAAVGRVQEELPAFAPEPRARAAAAVPPEPPAPLASSVRRFRGRAVD